MSEAMKMPIDQIERAYNHQFPPSADGWYVRDPDTAELLRAESFEECMERYGGFNVPFQITGGKIEPYRSSADRVVEFFTKKRAQAAEPTQPAQSIVGSTAFQGDDI